MSRPQARARPAHVALAAVAGLLACVATLERIAAEPAADDGVVRQKCLGRFRAKAIVAISDSLVLFQGQGAYWLNRLPKACPGVRPTSSLVMISRSPSQSWCRGDVFTYGERLVMCPLGEFERVTREQIEMLRRAKSE